MLQPEKDEAGAGRAPIPARFVLAKDTPEPQPEGEAEAVAASSRSQPGVLVAVLGGGAIVTADGKVYE